MAHNVHSYSILEAYFDFIRYRVFVAVLVVSGGQEDRIHLLALPARATYGRRRRLLFVPVESEMYGNMSG
jgi:hypothetical protein